MRLDTETLRYLSCLPKIVHLATNETCTKFPSDHLYPRIDALTFVQEFRHSLTKAKSVPSTIGRYSFQAIHSSNLPIQIF